VGGDGVNLIKGRRMRTDSMVGNRAVSLIMDIDNLRFVELDERKKVATVTPLATIADELAKVSAGAMQATLTPTAQQKTVSGFPCTVHDVRVSLPFSPMGQSGQGMDMTMVLSGTVCLSRAVPGLADYQAFYRAAADSGFIFGNPAAARSPTGAAQAKAYAALTNKMAEAGMALESHVTIGASGDNPMAGMMAKLAASDITTTVTKIEPGDVPADKLDIPAGYKVKMQK
ncbi:MAG TPA: hypothetical protein VFP37_14845, partial [Steroidobacteraceae bacterium]|nr:hypothetical protein [Steroidobacteraceae bacterium]